MNKHLPDFNFFYADGRTIVGSNDPGEAQWVVGTARVVGTFKATHPFDDGQVFDFERLEVTLLDGTIISAHRLASSDNNYNIVEDHGEENV